MHNQHRQAASVVTAGAVNITFAIYLFNTINSTLNPRHNRQSRGGWWPRWVWACRRCPPMRSWGCICRPIRGRGRSTAPSPSRCHTPAWPRPCCRPGQASHCRGGRGDTAPSSPRGSSERSASELHSEPTSLESIYSWKARFKQLTIQTWCKENF